MIIFVACKDRCAHAGHVCAHHPRHRQAQEVLIDRHDQLNGTNYS